MSPLPSPLAGTALRVLATSDLGAATLPYRTTHGESGTCAGVAALLAAERERGPAVWLDLGDLVVGHVAHPALGQRPWDEVADLPIAAGVPGNHDFDDGVDAFRGAAARLRFPLVCANVDVGLPPATVVETGAGPLGVVGITHPRVDRLSAAPAPAPDWPARVPAAARQLRRDGARWVVALLHDGVEWWPEGDGIGSRADRLESLARPWAGDVDLIVGGHNFGAWTGELAGTPAGEPHLFASSILLADLGDGAAVRGAFRVPAVRPPGSSPARAVVEAAAARVVGELSGSWLTRTGAPRYLPDLLADALRTATGADAGFALPDLHGVQAPFDGAIAALGPGPVTELDVARLCAAPDYDPVVVELRPGELRAAAAAQWATADPRNANADGLHWNWCRMPAGVSAGAGEPATVATFPGAVPRLRGWIGRDAEAVPAGVTARAAIVGALDR